MNRSDRRRRNRQIRQDIAPLKRDAEARGEPWGVVGFEGACIDCTATAAIIVEPDRRATAHIYHDEGCPAAAGRHHLPASPMNQQWRYTWQSHEPPRRIRMTDTPIPDDAPLRLELLERQLRQLLARLTTVAARSQARLDAIRDSQQQ